MNRRGFLKFAAGGTVGLVASPIIWNTLYDAVYWTQNWGWIPRLKKGDNEYLPTISKLCPSGTGIRVRLVGGRPVRALGNPGNAMSKGALTALAAAETQLQVSPARLKTPLRRSPDGAYVAISWEEAETLLKTKAQEARGATACISGDPTSSVNEVFTGLLSATGSSDFYFMPGEELPALKAWSLMGGQGRLGYDIERSDFILSIGANFLESWGTVARNRRAFSAKRPAGQEPSLKVAYAGPVQNNTASVADWWLPIRPDGEMALALGVAHLLIKKGKAPFVAGMPGFASLVEEYAPAKVTQLTGVDPKRLEAVVDALMAAQKPLVVAGSPLGAGGGAGPIMVTIAINMLLGRVGQEGNLKDLPFPSPVVNRAESLRALLSRDLVAWTKAVAAGTQEAPKMLLVYDANPLYALPPDSGMAEVLDKTPFKVALASFMSETCARCDLVLPAAMGLERFDDAYTPYGSGQINYSVAAPVVAPFYESRPVGELMIALAQEMGVDLGVEDMPSLLNKKAMSLGTDFKAMTESGEVFLSDRQAAFSVPVFNVGAIQTAASALPAGNEVRLAPVVVLGMGTPQTAIPPFATKIITDYQLKGMDSVAQMNGATAAKLGVKTGDRLKLDNGAASVTVLVDVFEGVQTDAVALCAGLGHTAFDEYSQGKGINIMTLTGVKQEPGTGLSVWGDAKLAKV